jgi:hypothetical protein
MYGARVQSLLWTTEANEVLDHRRNVLALQAFHVAVAYLACEEGVFGKCFLDLWIC